MVVPSGFSSVHIFFFLAPYFPRKEAHAQNNWSRSAAQVLGVSESNYIQKYALMCMNLAAECRVAAAVPEPDLSAHFLRMASMWTQRMKASRRFNARVHRTFL
jgi:hypothetical protein